MIEGRGPDIVAFEGPFIPMGPQKDKGAHSFGGKPAFVTTAQTLRLQIALATTIETVAKKHGLRCIEVATSSAKVALAGSARLGDKKKSAMVEAAWARGWQVADDHQADALAVCMVTYDSLGQEG
jgi:Holliday junction resolvasome RuvABC endonuclease subunit